MKIRGVIGNAARKDWLSSVSLSRHINDGRRAGYSEKEIIVGVLKSMARSLQLRNVLETMTDVTLERSMSFLQAHFEQGNAPDLCRKPPSMS